MSHPSTQWRSSGVPLASSFLMLIALSRGRGSLRDVIENTLCVASGAAFFPRDVQSAMFSIIVIILLMYPSAKWLNDHILKDNYNASPAKVKEILGSNNSAQNFEGLTHHKNLVLLMKSPIGAKIQASFYHSSIGIPIIQDKLNHLARIGIMTGTSMIVELESLLQISTAVHKSDIVDMLNVAD